MKINLFYIGDLSPTFKLAVGHILFKNTFSSPYILNGQMVLNQTPTDVSLGDGKKKSD